MVVAEDMFIKIAGIAGTSSHALYPANQGWWQIYRHILGASSSAGFPDTTNLQRSVVDKLRVIAPHGTNLPQIFRMAMIGSAAKCTIETSVPTGTPYTPVRIVMTDVKIADVREDYSQTDRLMEVSLVFSSIEIATFTLPLGATIAQRVGLADWDLVNNRSL